MLIMSTDNGLQTTDFVNMVPELVEGSLSKAVCRKFEFGTSTVSLRQAHFDKLSDRTVLNSTANSLSPNFTLLM